MAYVYSTVQIPPNIQTDRRESGNEAAIYLDKVINSKAAEGWEFQSVESIGVSVKPGCLEALKGTKQAFNTYYVIVFKREIP